MFLYTFCCIICWFAKWVPGQKLMLFGGGQGVEKLENPWATQYQGQLKKKKKKKKKLQIAAFKDGRMRFQS